MAGGEEVAERDELRDVVGHELERRRRRPRGRRVHPGNGAKFQNTDTILNTLRDVWYSSAVTGGHAAAALVLANGGKISIYRKILCKLRYVVGHELERRVHLDRERNFNT